MAFEIAKAGWMMRESAILKRWKRNYFVLYRDGVFKYFEDERNPVAEEAMVVKQPNVLRFKEGLNLIDTNQPSGYSRTGLFKIKCNDKSWTVCADSLDDYSAWKMALEEANTIPYNPPPRQSKTTATATVLQSTPYPYPAGGQTYSTVYPPQTTHVYQTGQGLPAGTTTTQTVYVTGQPYGTVVQPAPAPTQTIVVQTQPYYRRNYYDDWWW